MDNIYLCLNIKVKIIKLVLLIIILDNARVHNNNLVKETIINSGNKYLFTISYTPKINYINYFEYAYNNKNFKYYK